MEQTNMGAQAAPATRSGLLSTMCILTWVWGGIAIILGLLGFASPLADKAKTGIDLLANIGSVFGAVMMWKMNRTGLWIYLGCELIPYITSFVFVGMGAAASQLAFLGSWIAGMIYVVLGFMVILDLLFVFLYHLGLKQSGK
jgi:hypothetical protein